MIIHTVHSSRPNPGSIATHPELRAAPPKFIEYGFYFWLFYNVFGDAVGISIGSLGIAMLALLTLYCIGSLKARALQVYKPVFLPLAFGISFIAIQVFLHDESLMGTPVRAFVPWLLNVLLVYSLALRPGFLHRFSWTALGVGLCLLPFLAIRADGSVERAGLEGDVGLANPNDLSAWFGYLAVYFTVLAINTKRDLLRVLSSSIAVGCFFIVALTVSRSPILAAGIAILIAFRNLFTRGFMPILVLAVTIFVAHELGIFDRYIGEYVQRGTEETGRLIVWPLVIDRIFDSPWIGVGISKIETYIGFGHDTITPHNNFLLVALASGIVPLILFARYWWRVARGTFKASATQYAPFQVPLFVYGFLQAQVLNFTFMVPWLIVILSIGLHLESNNVIHRAGSRPKGRAKRFLTVSRTVAKPRDSLSRIGETISVKPNSTRY